jgi:hypothetical protein
MRMNVRHRPGPYFKASNFDGVIWQVFEGIDIELHQSGNGEDLERCYLRKPCSRSVKDELVR